MFRLRRGLPQSRRVLGKGGNAVRGEKPGRVTAFWRQIGDAQERSARGTRTGIQVLFHPQLLWNGQLQLGNQSRRVPLVQGSEVHASTRRSVTGVFVPLCLPPKGLGLSSIVPRTIDTPQNYGCASLVLGIGLGYPGSMYKCVCTSVEGFIQQLAVGLIPHGYFFYVMGCIPEGKEPQRVDAKLIERYSIGVSKWTRAR
jgi:hypothetical protein